MIWSTLHAGCDVRTGGEKWVANQWVSGSAVERLCGADGDEDEDEDEDDGEDEDESERRTNGDGDTREDEDEDEEEGNEADL